MAQLPGVKKNSGFLPLGDLRPGIKSSATTMIAHDVVHPPAPLLSQPGPVSAALTHPAAGVSTALSPSIGRPKRAGLGIGERQFFQVLSDWIVVAGGGWLILVSSERGYSPDAVAISMGILSMLWFFFADVFDAYKMPVLQSTFKSGYTAAKVLALTIICYTLVAWFTGGLLPVIRPRISETLEAVLLVVPLLAERTFISALLTRAPLRRRVVVVGANRDGFEMGEALAHYDGKTYEFLGYFDDDPRSSGVMEERNRSNQRVPTKLAHFVWPTTDLLTIHRNIGVDQVVLANPGQTVGLLKTLSLLHEQGVQITPMFAIYQDLTGRVPVSHLGDDWYVALPAHAKKTSCTYLIAKRGMDLAMAFGVLLLTAPVMPLVALAIKLDSAGPVFFKQVRVGRGGKPFKIVKFRTMRHGAEAVTGAVWASDKDPRITRVGKFLRKSRLDEIPQLWNVIVGEMSFVGPRPERPEFDEELEREIPFYRARRAVRPGLTGWAQVRYGYGNTLRDALRKVEYDLYYIKNESMYLDLLILLRTVAVVLRLGGT